MENKTEGIRINKYIASCGQYSRRKADELIKNGNVKINGTIMKKLGYKVIPGDKVVVNGSLQETNLKKLYYILNKPIGYVTTMEDEFDRPTVVDLMNDVAARVFPVGRLDYMTEGLLIMTNDGEFAHKLSHPSNKIGKKYIVVASGFISDKKIRALRNGIEIDGYKTGKAEVRVIKQNKTSTVLEMVIFEGKNRQIRKMIQAVGSKVESLKRVAIGNVQLGHLKTGHFRKMRQIEIESLVNKKI